MVDEARSNDDKPRNGEHLASLGESKPSSDKLTSERALSRRDIILAGVGGLIGVATGVVGTVVTTYVQERARTKLASANLEVFAKVQWNVAGFWKFYSPSPIDLSKQPEPGMDGNDANIISYLVEHGCVSASPLMVVLYLSRPGDSPAVVRDITLLNHRQYGPISGASYLHETAGANDNAVFAVNLDEQNPHFVRSNYSDMWDISRISNQPDAFSTSTFSVAPHLTESMTLIFNTSRLTHEFALSPPILCRGTRL